MIYYKIVDKTFPYSQYLKDPLNEILKNVEMDEISLLIDRHNYKYQRIYMGIRLNFVNNDK